LKGIVLFDNEGRRFRNSYGGENFLVYVFRALDYEGRLIDSSDEGVPKWVDNKDMKTINPREADEKLWELVCGRRKFFALFKYNGEVLDENRCDVTYWH